MVNNFILVVFLFLALNFPPFFSLTVADFEPVNASWAVPFEIILR